VALEVSFRSTPPVLALVDAVFDGAAGEGVVSPAGRLVHIPHRQGAAGLVELWPLQIAARKADPPRWDVAEEDTSGSNAQARLARALALRIRHMLAHETLPARSDGAGQTMGRRVRPEDILILVRRRNALTRLIIRELKQADVPVGGLDRIALTAQIGVQDVLALLDVLLLPQDDLALAALLKSPLVGLSEEALFDLAQPRDGSLHAADVSLEREVERRLARLWDGAVVDAARRARRRARAPPAETVGEGEGTGQGACESRPAQPPPPGPVSAAGRAGEHEVELLLNRQLVPPVVRGVMHYLVRWRGHTAADDSWLRVEELEHCRDLVALDLYKCRNVTDEGVLAEQ
jgi:ATP-dependent helicase/nuclease subunit A